jgi:Pentapeptide repeats (8 copies)
MSLNYGLGPLTQNLPGVCKCSSCGEPQTLIPGGAVIRNASSPTVSLNVLTPSQSKNMLLSNIMNANMARANMARANMPKANMQQCNMFQAKGKMIGVL